MAGDDPQYLAWCRKQRCCMFGGFCAGIGVEAHHATFGRGMGQKGPDARAFPFCARHHRQFHDAAGDFRGMDHGARTAFQEAQVRTYRARYEASLETLDEATAVALAPLSPPTIPPNDPRAFAEQFCRAHELGPQVAFDLERWLRRYEKSFGP
jgi:hypothetical protein